jgi:hypothetical protein
MTTDYHAKYYSEDDLNKLCFQNATGSGKTLLMHVSLLQIGSKKFIEGWDCWRVSAMGLMHVGPRRGNPDHPVLWPRRASERLCLEPEAQRPCQPTLPSCLYR